MIIGRGWGVCSRGGKRRSPPTAFCTRSQEKHPTSAILKFLESQLSCHSEILKLCKVSCMWVSNVFVSAISESIPDINSETMRFKTKAFGNPSLRLPDPPPSLPSDMSRTEYSKIITAMYFRFDSLRRSSGDPLTKLELGW